MDPPKRLKWIRFSPPAMRYGKATEHNGKVPRDHWVELWEREAIIAYFDQHPLEGYRRLTFMMLDDDIVAVSQPVGPHMHWHIDLAVITIACIYYYLCSVLDGYSHAVVAWDFADRMTEADVELILQRRHPRRGPPPR